MLVSIITPAYNAQDYISQTIESVLNQTYQKWEMLIVDDGSNDETIDIIKTYQNQDSRIQLIEFNNRGGPALARNKAIELSKGKYIAFLDSDDKWVTNKLELQVPFMKKNDLAFSYSSYFLIDEKDKSLGIFNTTKEISYTSILKTCNVGCLTAIYDVEKLGKMYMKNIPKGQDYTLWLQIMKKIETTQGIEEPLAYYRIQNTSVSSNKVNAAKVQWSIYRNIEKIGFIKSVYYFLHYAYSCTTWY